MAAKLRIKGRILLVGNEGLMHLVLATGVMLILCINFSVLTYELFIKKGDNTLVDFTVSLFLFLFSRGICWLIHLGVDRFFLRRSQQAGERAADLFRYLNPVRAAGALAFGAVLSSLKLFYLLLSFLPFGAMLYILYYSAVRGVSVLVAASLAAGCVLLFISGAIFYTSISASLFTAKYHYICGDCISFRQIFSSSVQEMKHRKSLLIKLKLSFRGWFLLSLLVFPIGYVWSYYNQTLAVAAAEFMSHAYLQDG